MSMTPARPSVENTPETEERETSCIDLASGLTYKANQVANAALN